jgi:hypothetical protein
MIKNKNIFFILMLLGLATMACEKVLDDKIPPTIVLNGSSVIQLIVGCDFSDPGAFASDDKSEPLIYVSGNLNLDSAGVYYLDYTAVDSDSNTAVVSRKVIVQPFDFSFYNGDFQVFDTLLTFPRRYEQYNTSISIINPSPETFRIQNFNNFGESFSVLFVPDSMGLFQLEYNKADTIIEGNGYPSCDASGFKLIYTVETPGASVVHHKTSYK